MVEEREREIIKIVQSIADLNEIFRDLATMIVEQVGRPVLVTCYVLNRILGGTFMLLNQFPKC